MRIKFTWVWGLWEVITVSLVALEKWLPKNSRGSIKRTKIYHSQNTKPAYKEMRQGKKRKAVKLGEKQEGAHSQASMVIKLTKQEFRSGGRLDLADSWKKQRCQIGFSLYFAKTGEVPCSSTPTQALHRHHHMVDDCSMGAQLLF